VGANFGFRADDCIYRQITEEKRYGVIGDRANFGFRADDCIYRQIPEEKRYGVMGDRANFGFRADQNSPVVVLYAHWGGYQMMSNLAHAIAKARGRWHDDGYATRICISQLIGSDWDQELSFGIYVDNIKDPDQGTRPRFRLSLNEHPVPVVNWADQSVSLYEVSWTIDFYNDKPKFTTGIDFYNDKPKFTIGLEDFISKFAKWGIVEMIDHIQDIHERE